MSEIKTQILASKGAPGRSRLFAPAGQSTQMIIGATPTPDAQILKTASGLYQRHGLRRVYYSAYSPIPHSDPMLPSTAAPLVREHRLYQADWLIRFYGYKADEIVSGPEANLSLHEDPKLSWALRHRDFFPIDINAAPLAALLRVPGIGVRNAQRIVSSRRFQALRLEDLAKLKVSVRKAKFFVKTLDNNPSLRDLDRLQLPDQFVQPQQLMLIEAAGSALSGQL